MSNSKKPIVIDVTNIQNYVFNGTMRVPFGIKASAKVPENEKRTGHMDIEYDMTAGETVMGYANKSVRIDEQRIIRKRFKGNHARLTTWLHDTVKKVVKVVISELQQQSSRQRKTIQELVMDVHESEGREAALAFIANEPAWSMIKSAKVHETILDSILAEFG